MEHGRGNKRGLEDGGFSRVGMQAETAKKQKAADKEEVFVTNGGQKHTTTGSWYPGKAHGQPPRLGQKEVPEGAPRCLEGSRFVVTGVLESLEREDCEDLIRKYHGHVSKSVGKKLTYLVAGDEAGPSKLNKAKTFGVPVIDEDGLFDLIRSSKGQASAAPEAAVKSETKQEPIEIPVSREFLQSQPQLQVPSIYAKKKKKPASQLVKQGKLEATAGTSGLWVESMKPTMIREIIGNSTSVKKILEFLSSWNPNSSQRKSGELAVLISGPPGIGKTTAASIAAKELGFKVVEMNASDTRNKKAMKESVSTVTGNFGIGEYATPTGRDKHASPNTVLIMDEVDGTSSGDRGGMAELIKLIKISNVPIICICNDRQSPKVRSLANHCVDLRFRRPTTRQIASKLCPKVRAFGLDIDEPSIEKVATSSQADIRQVINTLQMWSSTRTSMNFDQVRANLDDAKKDVEENVFSSVQEFFRPPNYTSKSWFNDRLSLYFNDPGLMPLFVFEKYSGTGSPRDDYDSLSRLADAADCISESDLVDNQMRSVQSFALMPTHAALSCVLPSLYMAGLGGRGQSFFPAWLGKNSTRRKNSRLLGDVKVHMSRAVSGDSQAVLLDYIPVLEKEIRLPLVQQGKEAVAPVLETMATYGLDLDDVAAIQGFMEFFNFKKQDKVPTTVKTHLTKTFKKNRHMHSRKQVKKSTQDDLMAEEDDDHLAGQTVEDNSDSEEDDPLLVKKKRPTKAAKAKKGKAKKK